jgi:acyl carrier protein
VATTPALDAIEEDLKRYLIQTANAHGRAISDLDPDDDFVERQVLDSMALLDFVVHVEAVTGLKIPGEDVVPENFGSLAAIARYLEARLPSAGG